MTLALGVAGVALSHSFADKPEEAEDEQQNEQEAAGVGGGGLVLGMLCAVLAGCFDGSLMVPYKVHGSKSFHEDAVYLAAFGIGARHCPIAAQSHRDGIS
jgi:hypothetical protein